MYHKLPNTHILQFPKAVIAKPSNGNSQMIKFLNVKMRKRANLQHFMRSNSQLRKYISNARNGQMHKFKIHARMGKVNA